MNKVDRYFPYEEGKESKKSESIDMEKVSNVIKVQIDNAMKSAVEELKNNIKEEKEKKDHDNNFESEQRIDKEGKIPVDAKSSDSNNPES